MKIDKALIALSPLLIALAVTYFLGVRSSGLFVAYFVVLDMVLSLLSTFLFISYWLKEKEYEESVLKNAKIRKQSSEKYRIAVLIPIYNEPPRIVAETAAISMAAVENFGEVFVLDDSTDPEIRKRIDQYSAEVGFKVIRRASRKGYKAGAVNYWLKNYGNLYDFMIIMDADQRLIPGVFDYVMKFFDDPEVAFVQIPQYYSKLDTAVAIAAYIQQLPFFRVIMRGRHLKGSAFSLGTGTIYRIKHLISVGGLYEETVTEDIYTSLNLHESGYKSVYIDLPFVWSGEAPHDLPSYMSQQNRWALGTFQLLGKLLDSDLSASKFLDYLNGFYYWLHVGPLTIFDIIAPVFFLIFGIYFMTINPLAYIAVYLPIVIGSLILYLKIMMKYGYGIKEFMYHQGVQSLLSFPVTLALFEWIFRKKKGFSVTPKGKGRVRFSRYHFYYAFIVAILLASTLFGIFKAMQTEGPLFYAYLFNIFWALWWLVITSYGLYISFAPLAPKEMVDKVAQAYEGLEWHALRLLNCAVYYESAIGSYYLKLSRNYPEYHEQLNKIAVDSYRHARIYYSMLKSLKEAGSSVQNRKTECEWTKPHMDEIEIRKDAIEKGSMGKWNLSQLLLISEEILMGVYAELILETCKYLLVKVDEVESIIKDEADHEAILREIIEKVNQAK